VIVYFGQFFNYRSSPNVLDYLFHGERYVPSLPKNGLGYISGDFFSNSYGQQGNGVEYICKRNFHQTPVEKNPFFFFSHLNTNREKKSTKMYRYNLVKTLYVQPSLSCKPRNLGSQRTIPFFCKILYNFLISFEFQKKCT
jgi:hypothetical protein